MFEGQPKGLWTLALANTGERFGYYTMLAVFALFLGENFGFAAGTASEIYTWFLTAVYFLPLFGGMAADKWGYNRMVIIGIIIMFIGYLLLSLPMGGKPYESIATLIIFQFKNFKEVFVCSKQIPMACEWSLHRSECFRYVA